jgi:hypothetical protein
LSNACKKAAPGLVIGPAGGVILVGGIVSEIIEIGVDLWPEPDCKPLPLPPRKPKPCPKNDEVTICFKTDDWFEQHPGDPDSGERLCKYKCNNGQEYLGHGTECDQDMITR